MPWARNVEIVEGDLARPETLPDALDGVDVAYYLVHSLGQGGFEAAEREAAQHFAAAARGRRTPGCLSRRARAGRRR